MSQSGPPRLAPYLAAGVAVAGKTVDSIDVNTDIAYSSFAVRWGSRYSEGFVDGIADEEVEGSTDGLLDSSGWMTWLQSLHSS
jgi:hypothetical protein